MKENEESGQSEWLKEVRKLGTDFAQLIVGRNLTAGQIFAFLTDMTIVNLEALGYNVDRLSVLHDYKKLVERHTYKHIQIDDKDTTNSN